MAPGSCATPTATGGCDWDTQPAAPTARVPWLGFPWQTLWSNQRIEENSRALFCQCVRPIRGGGGQRRGGARGAGNINPSIGRGRDRQAVAAWEERALLLAIDIDGVWSVVEADV